MAKRVWEEFHALEDDMLRGFSEEELEMLYDCITRIHVNIKNLLTIT